MITPYHKWIGPCYLGYDLSVKLGTVKILNGQEYIAYSFSEYCGDGVIFYRKNSDWKYGRELHFSNLDVSRKT